MRSSVVSLIAAGLCGIFQGNAGAPEPDRSKPDFKSLDYDLLIILGYGDPVTGGARPEALEELRSRPNITEILLAALEHAQRTRQTKPSYGLYVRALAELMQTDEAQHKRLLSVVRDAWANYKNQVSTGPGGDYEKNILYGAGTYLAFHPSPEGEPLVIEMIRNADFVHVLPVLQQTAQKPSRERVEAMRDRLAKIEARPDVRKQRHPSDYELPGQIAEAEQRLAHLELEPRTIPPDPSAASVKSGSPVPTTAPVPGEDDRGHGGRQTALILTALSVLAVVVCLFVLFRARRS